MAAYGMLPTVFVYCSFATSTNSRWVPCRIRKCMRRVEHACIGFSLEEGDTSHFYATSLENSIEPLPVGFWSTGRVQ